MGWQGKPHAPMGDNGNNAKRRRIEALQERARELAEQNTRRHDALPPDKRPGTAAIPVLKIETLVRLWAGGDPEREAQFAVAYQEQLGEALGSFEDQAAQAAKPKLIRPAETGIVTPITSKPRHPTGG